MRNVVNRYLFPGVDKNRGWLKYSLACSEKKQAPVAYVRALADGMSVVLFSGQDAFAKQRFVDPALELQLQRPPGYRKDREASVPEMRLQQYNNVRDCTVNYAFSPFLRFRKSSSIRFFQPAPTGAAQTRIEQIASDRTS